MEMLSFEGLAAWADGWDALVAETPDIDRFCTSSAWIVPARAAFCPSAGALIARDEGCAVALMTLPIGRGRLGALPLEAGWGLAGPFAGRDPYAVVGLLDRLWAAAPEPVDALFLSGLPQEGAWLRALMRQFARDKNVGVGTRCVRRVAALDGGLAGFMGRRSAKFRANLRRAARRAEREGFGYERVDGGDLAAVYGRVLDVERRSWKGRQGDGIDTGLPRAFYRLIVERLLARDALRVVFVQRDGQDVAYVLGGLFGETYRGLQVSFDDALSAFEPGNLAQRAMIEWLCEAGLERYDLGTDMPYKRRWAEEAQVTVTVAIAPKGGSASGFFY